MDGSLLVGENKASCGLLLVTNEVQGFALWQVL